MKQQNKYHILLAVICFEPFLFLSGVKCASRLTLTTSPVSLFNAYGSFCDGPVTISCDCTDISYSFFWRSGNTDIGSHAFRTSFTYPRPIITQIEGVTAEVVSATYDGGSLIDLFSNIYVTEVSILHGQTIHCEDGSNTHSNLITINVIDFPPSPTSATCSIVSRTGGTGITMQWDSTFNADYHVEKYMVAVNKDTLSSCRNSQLSPNAGYSCTGLAVGTSYSFTASAVNCVDKIGATRTITVHIFSPEITPTVTVVPVLATSGMELAEIMVLWQHVDQPVISQDCSYDGELNYRVTLEKSGGENVEKMINSNTCVRSKCRTSFDSPSNSYTVKVTATNWIGESPTIDIQSNEVEINPSGVGAPNITIASSSAAVEASLVISITAAVGAIASYMTLK